MSNADDSMMHDKKVIGNCGETSISNAKQSIVTMSQVSRSVDMVQSVEPAKTSGIRVLYISSLGEILRVPVRINHLFARLFLHVQASNARHAQAALHLESDYPGLL